MLLQQEALTDELDKILKKTARSVAKQAKDVLGLLSKADEPGNNSVTDTPIEEVAAESAETTAVELSSFWEELSLSTMDAIASTVPAFLSSVMQDSAKYVILQLGLDDKITGVVNKDSLEYAKDRAAEMIGKVWKDGQLVDNPRAKWVITDTTRDEIRLLVEKVMRGEMNATDLPDAIKKAGAFSRARAAMIARTELMAANAQGSLASFFAAQDAGVKVKKAWMTDGEACDICVINEKKGAIKLEALFPDGSLAPPSHPNCECVIVPEIEKEEGD